MFNFVIFLATKKGRTANFFSPLSFVAIFGSGMDNSGINIPDPQHRCAPTVYPRFPGYEGESPLPPVREIIKLNDEKSVIEVVHGRAEDIDLPHQGWKSQR
jgi:hypothetical protein